MVACLSRPLYLMLFSALLGPISSAEENGERDTRVRCESQSSSLDPFREAITKVQQATVRVWCDQGGNPIVTIPSRREIRHSMGAGGGVLFADGNLVITARHNFAFSKSADDQYGRKYKPASSCLIEDSHGKFHKILNVHFVHDDWPNGNSIVADVAIAEINGSVEGVEPLKLAERGDLKDGLSVGHLANVHGYSSSSHSYDCLAQDSTVAEFTPGNKYQNGSFIFEGYVVEGNSGSPVFDSSGTILAVVMGGYSNENGGPRRAVALALDGPVQTWKDPKWGLVGKKEPRYPLEDSNP